METQNHSPIPQVNADSFKTVAQLASQPQPVLAYRPEFYPLPSRGRDPHFGFSRSAYYGFEKDGVLQLVRIRRPGNIRGKVLVRYEDMVALVQRLGARASTSLSAAVTAGGEQPSSGTNA